MNYIVRRLSRDKNNDLFTDVFEFSSQTRAIECWQDNQYGDKWIDAGSGMEYTVVGSVLWNDKFDILIDGWDNL